MLVIHQERRLGEYFKLKTLDLDTYNYFDIFNALYTDSVKRTFDDIAREFGIGLSTLYRIRKQIVKLTEELIRKENYFYKYIDFKTLNKQKLPA